MKTKLLLCALILFLFGCDKEDDSSTFTLIVNNPNIINSMELSSNAFSSVYLPQYIEIKGNVLGSNETVWLKYHLADMPEEVMSETSFIPKADGVYSWNPVFQNSVQIISEPGDTGNENIVGKWINLNGCANVNNEKTYFQFNSDGSGKIFNVDCNSSCSGYGYYLYFNYSDNGDSFTLNYTSVSEYCGFTAPTPSAETINYTKNGNQLTFGGKTWTKQ